MPSNEQYAQIDGKLQSAMSLRGSARNEALGGTLLLVRKLAFPTAVSWCRELLEGSVSDAVEFLDEAIVRAWAGLKHVKATTGKKFYNWFLTIVEHLIADEARRRERGGTQPRSLERDKNAKVMAAALEAKDASPEAAAICREFRPTLRRALKKKGLTRRDRLVALAWLEELSVGQIAAQLKYTKDEVRGSLERSFAHLRTVLADWRVIPRENIRGGAAAFHQSCSQAQASADTCKLR